MAVTPESNLALIEELQELVGAKTYEPVDGPEFSYPAVGQAVDDEMWQYITLALGDGVLDTGGSPYLLTDARNNDNTMELRVSRFSGNAQAVLKGFYHRLLKNMRLEFPMPMSRTTYHVVLEMNPLRARSPEGPVSVKVYPNELNTESGRRHLTLWRVTREPNQLLTDAVVEKYTPRVVSTHLVYSWDQLPAPQDALWGAMYFIHETAETVMAVGANQDSSGPTRWKNITSPEWVDSTSNAFPAASSGFSPARRVVGDRLEFRGRCSRSDGSKFVAGSTYTLVPNVPDAENTVILNAGSDSSRNPVAMEVVKGDKPVFRPKNDTPYIDLNGFFYYWK